MGLVTAIGFKLTKNSYYARHIRHSSVGKHH
jgi:hypothetical protein